MISLSVTDFSRKLKTMLDLVEFRGEEIILIRNKHKIARILPGASHLTALEAMSDLYRTLSPEAGKTWEEESRLQNRLIEVNDPWEF
jgi:PHD/YefM family antitoxin component YafN of YafNO toxin-antitoxin module